MNGLGNDFVVIDRRRGGPRIDADAARRIADRRFGVGCDSVILIEPSDRADAFMRILNADGSESGACGNATRCVAERLMAESGAEACTVETLRGVLAARRAPGGIEIDMGAPRLAPGEIPLAGAVRDTISVDFPDADLLEGVAPRFAAVNMGNPHAIFFVAEAQLDLIGRIGPAIEAHPMFPERANISLVHVAARDHLVQRVHERGAGLTLACGSGACAAVVAAVRLGLADRRARVSLPGGDLEIAWTEDGGVLMSGPTALAFEGAFAPDFLASPAAARTRFAA
jgi:diaminopimelate epimerase